MAGLRSGTSGSGLRSGAGGSGVLGAVIPATGGDIIGYSNGWWYHMFTGDGTFDPGGSLAVEVLALGAGAGSSEGISGTLVGAGGAAGVARTYSGTISTPQAVSIGVGGAAGGDLGDPTGGGTTTFGALLTATGGNAVVRNSRTGGGNADFAGGTNATGTNAGGGAGAGGAGSSSNAGVGFEWPTGSGAFWGQGGPGGGSGAKADWGDVYSSATVANVGTPGSGAGGTSASGSGKTGMNGVVIVRHQGTATPTNSGLVYGLGGSSFLLHLDAAQLGLANGASLNGWADVSGNARNFVASTVPSVGAPQFVSNDGAGMAAVDFLSSITGLDGVSSWSSGVTEIEMILVCKPANDPAIASGRNGPPIFWGTTASGNQHFPHTDGSVYQGIFKSARSSHALAVAKKGIVYVSNIGGVQTFRWDGAQVATATSGISFAHGPFLGHNGFNTTSGLPAILSPVISFEGLIYEVIISKQALTAAQRQFLNMCVGVRQGVKV